MGSSARQRSPEPEEPAPDDPDDPNEPEEREAAEPEPFEVPLDEPEDDDPEESDASEPAAPGDEPDDPSSDDLGPARDAFVALDDERSFFAQPDPLKWTAGGANTFRIRPPQTGQADGPWSWTPWTTSIRWPQFVQA